MLKIWKYSLCLLTISFLLSACGSNSGSDSDHDNKTIVGVIETLNDIRQQVGLNPLSENQYLKRAAKNHAVYLEINKASGHYEDPNLRGFTGEWPSDRTVYAGYKSKRISENQSRGQKSELASIDGLMSAIYHRFGFLDMNIDEIGFYNENNNYYVYDMGNSYLNALCDGESYSGSGRYYYNVCADENFRIKATLYDAQNNKLKKSSPVYVVYPYNGQKNITPVFYEESPDPLPNYSVSGYPVSVLFNENKIDRTKLSVQSFTLEDETGDTVQVISFSDGKSIMDKDNDPNSHFSEYEFAIFPEERLDFDTKYTATFMYSYEGVNKTIKWSFRTKNPPDLITYTHQDLDIDINSSFNLYFPPEDQNDVISTYSTGCSYVSGGYAKVAVALYDKNTLSIQIEGKDINSCKVKINGEEKLQLNVK